jgi:hypothetical protein
MKAIDSAVPAEVIDAYRREFLPWRRLEAISVS